MALTELVNALRQQAIKQREREGELLNDICYGDGGNAGGAHGDFSYPRSVSSVGVGLFSAYVDPALYA